MYCPKCRSKLYPVDDEYMKKYGLCSYCISFKKKGLNTNEFCKICGDGITFGYESICKKCKGEQNEDDYEGFY